MSQIHVSDLTFCYDGSYDAVFEGASFTLDTDWKLGFVGRNGRGKTTFLKLLLGDYEYTGTISSGVPCDYFPFPVEDPKRCARDVALSLCPACMEWELLRELTLLQVDESVLDRPFDTLSLGEQTKLLLAALFLREGHFLLIDEPTNHLDADARDALGAYLRRKRGFILVSHDRALLDRCVDHVLSINRKTIEVMRGNFSTWWQNKESRDQFEQAEHDKLKRQIHSLTEAAKRTADWSDTVEKSKHGVRNSGLRPDTGYLGHKAAKLMKRSKAAQARIERAAQEQSALLQDIERTDALKLHPLTHRQDPLIEAEKLTLSYGGKKVCGPVTFSIRQGERIALLGRNGSGKSTILKRLLGDPVETDGRLRLASGLILSYLPQDASFLQGDFTQFAEKHSLDESLFKVILRKLDFAREQFDKDLRNLSAGQKKKVLLAKSLCEPAHLYVWDEPLNYIDVFSRMQIEQLLLEHRPTMLFVEHDRAFVDTVATRAIVL